MTAMTTKPIVPSVPSYPIDQLTEKQAIALGKPSTSKAKCRLGVPDDWEIVWVPASFALIDHQNVLALAKSLDIPAHEMLARVVRDWFDKNRDGIYSQAEAFVTAASTKEDLEKKVDALRRSLERTIANLELKKNSAPTE